MQQKIHNARKCESGTSIRVSLVEYERIKLEVRERMEIGLGSSRDRRLIGSVTQVQSIRNDVFDKCSLAGLGSRHLLRTSFCQQRTTNWKASYAALLFPPYHSMYSLNRCPLGHSAHKKKGATLFLVTRT